MKNLTVKKLEKKYENIGLIIGKATDWIESLNHANQWHQYEIPKRCYGIMLDYSDTGCKYVVRHSFTTLQQIVDYLEDHYLEAL